MPRSLARRIRRRIIPAPLKGKPFRRLQRECYQRIYTYPHRNLLAIGQQKSGSTWLFRMMQDVPGYMRWTPKNIKFQRADLRLEDFVPPPPGWSVTKVHTPPTPENLRVIGALGRPYVVLVRDVRDICVSWAHYIHITPDHPRHEECGGLTIPQTIDYFIRERLPDYVRWQLAWRDHIHPGLGLLIKYEAMLADTPGVMRRVFDHYEVGLDDARVLEIVERHAFKRATGRENGQADSRSFNRKGVAGDWANHLTDAQQAAFKAVASDALVSLGYEAGGSW